MARKKTYATILTGLFLLAGLVVSSAGQDNRQPNMRQKNLLLDFNISGTIGWKTGTGWANVTNKNCSDLRVTISEKIGTKIVPGGIPIDELKAIGYVYPTAIANSTDCSYRVKLPVNTPRYLSVERMGSTGNPIGYPEGWQNPITVKAGEKLIRDFKMGMPLIH
jgi:hypothetical protein